MPALSQPEPDTSPALNLATVCIELELRAIGQDGIDGAGLNQVELPDNGDRKDDFTRESGIDLDFDGRAVRKSISDNR